MRTLEEIRRDVAATQAELDPLQMAALRQLTDERKVQLMADLCDTMRDMAFASERYFHPELPEHEIRKRVMLRLWRADEWEPAQREWIIGELNRRLG